MTALLSIGLLALVGCDKGGASEDGAAEDEGGNASIGGAEASSVTDTGEETYGESGMQDENGETAEEPCEDSSQDGELTTEDPYEDSGGEGSDGEVTTEDPYEDSGGEGSESEDTSEGMGFVVEPDFGTPDVCDPFLQNCPAGEKCVAYASDGASWDANTCVPVIGEKAPGEACTLDSLESGIDDCGPDSYCFFGTCTAFCGGDPQLPTCALGSTCLIANNGSLNLCMSECDPLLQDCAAGSSCVYAMNTFMCIPQSEQISDPGDPCESLNDCASGSVCVGPEMVPGCVGPGCCTSFCDVDGPPEQCGDQPGTACVSFGDEFDPIGVCVAL